MDNFSQNAERRHIVDNSAVNNFLTKMYSIMGLAVLVSALTAYLTLTVFAQSFVRVMTSSSAALWLMLLLPLFLSMGISFRANRNPVASFIMLMLIAVIYGFEFSILAFAYTSASLVSAFISSAAVFIAMAVYGTVTKRDLSTAGSYANAALWGLIVATLVNMFLRSSAATYIFSYIAVVIFLALTAWDAQRMKQIYLTYGNQVSNLGLAVSGALQLYLDFVNLFLQFLQIFGYSDSNK